MNIFLGVFLLLLACAGNAEWWVMLVNRRHALRYRHAQLLKIRHLHDAGLLLFPPFIVWIAGLADHGLLRGGTFAELPSSVQIILIVAWSGVIPLAWSVIRYQLSCPPTELLSVESTVVDALAVAPDEETRQRIRGDRDSKFLKFPANEIFHLDINRKRIKLAKRSGAMPTFPTDALRLAHFSDVHLLGTPGPGYLEFVTDRLADFRPDVFLFTGDLLDRDDLLPQAERAFQQLLDVAPGYFVLGNHDWHLDHERIRDCLKSVGWQSLAGGSQAITIRDWKVLLAGTELPWMGQNPDVPPRGDEHLRIMLSHTPDQRNFCTDNNFDLMTCGHNHGGQVVLPVIGPVYSPSIYGVKYAGGMYRHEQLLMHVSRGTGAKDLLRWRCPPEVTLLEIEFAGTPE